MCRQANDTMRPSWRNLKHANQRTMTLGNDAFNIRQKLLHLKIRISAFRKRNPQQLPAEGSLPQSSGDQDQKLR